jgi:hypothetical protein
MIINWRPISSKSSATACLTFTNVPVVQSRSVLSIVYVANLDPAVYYAHLAGNRARAHDPSRDRDEDSSGSDRLSTSMGQMQIDVNVTPLKPLHANIQDTMWWM